jgi:hypothetical protein
MAEHCCETMTYWANYKCPEHPDIFACPDNILYFNSQRHTYGLIVHDGGSSSIEIEFCPWCGASLKGHTNK